MTKKYYPIRKIKADIEVLGGEITLSELTVGHRLKVNEDSEFDTPTNALIDAGLTLEQVNKLGSNVANDLYNDIVDLTYPQAREEMMKMLEDGNYIAPTETEIELSKKN